MQVYADEITTWGTHTTGNISPSSIKRERTIRRRYADADKAFRCEYENCGKQFVYKHHLRRHETKAHGRKPQIRQGKNATYW